MLYLESLEISLYGFTHMVPSVVLLVRRAVWRFRGVPSAARMSSQVHSDTERIISASISSVSPVELVSKSLKFDSSSRTLSVQGHQYPINK